MLGCVGLGSFRDLRMFALNHAEEPLTALMFPHCAKLHPKIRRKANAAYYCLFRFVHACIVILQTTISNA